MLLDKHKRKSKGYDPVETLFFEANKRAQSRRNSTADFHLPAALTAAHDHAAYKRTIAIKRASAPAEPVEVAEIHDSRPKDP